MTFKIGQTVKHKKRTLHEAEVYGWSRTGKKVGVIHNAYYPYGVSWVVGWFNPENIETR
jgi:hypothetical protein